MIIVLGVQSSAWHHLPAASHFGHLLTSIIIIDRQTCQATCRSSVVVIVEVVVARAVRRAVEVKPGVVEQNGAVCRRECRGSKSGARVCRRIDQRRTRRGRIVTRTECSCRAVRRLDRILGSHVDRGELTATHRSRIQIRQVELCAACLASHLIWRVEQGVLSAEQRIISKLKLVAWQQFLAANTAREALVVVDLRLALHDQVVSV